MPGLLVYCGGVTEEWCLEREGERKGEVALASTLTESKCAYRRSWML